MERGLSVEINILPYITPSEEKEKMYRLNLIEKVEDLSLIERIDLGLMQLTDEKANDVDSF